MKNKNFIVIALAVILVACLVGCSSTPTSSNDTPQTEAQKEAYGVNEVATLDGVNVTMVSIGEVTSDNQFMVPTDGNVFVQANFLIENNSDKEISVSSLLSFEAYFDGFASSADITAMSLNTGAATLDGTVAPGKKLQGIIGYQVPTTWKEAEIQFIADVLSNNKLTFKYAK